MWVQTTRWPRDLNKSSKTRSATNAGLFLLVLISIFVLAKKTFFKSRTTEIPKYGNYLSCQGYPFDLRIKFQSTVYLDKASLPKKQDVYFNTIYYQNMFTFTNTSDYNGSQSLKWSALSSKDPLITIVKVEDAPYPLDIELPRDLEFGGFPPAPTEYLKNLKTRGKIKKGSPAVKITYDYENDLLLCFDKNKIDLSDIKIVQPIDPYTTYFVVPKEERRLIQNPISNFKRVINPCLNPEIASSLELSPFMSWFFWRPFAEGHDSEKRSFNCKDYYKDKVSINTLNLKITENDPQKTSPLSFGKFENLNRPLSVSVFMGGEETKFFKKFDKEAENYIKLYLSGIDATRAKKELPYYHKKYDPMFSTLLWFIRNINEKIDIRKTEYVVEDYYAKVTLKGKFRLSHKDIVIKVFLNQTSPAFEGNEDFARFFADEFLNNDIVTFDGHVSQGNVFRKSINQYQDAMRAKEDKNMSYQIFALYSCTANFFYHPASFPRVSNNNFRRDFITTGGGFRDSSANSSLILLGQVDSYLYNKTQAPFLYWTRMAKADNFYILSNH